MLSPGSEILESTATLKPPVMSFNKAAAECVRFVSEVATKFMCFVSKAAA